MPIQMMYSPRVTVRNTEFQCFAICSSAFQIFSGLFRSFRSFQIFSDVLGRRFRCEVSGCQMKDMGSCGNACCATRLKMLKIAGNIGGSQGLSVLQGDIYIYMP